MGKEGEGGGPLKSPPFVVCVRSPPLLLLFMLLWREGESYSHSSGQQGIQHFLKAKKNYCSYIFAKTLCFSRKLDFFIKKYIFFVIRAIVVHMHNEQHTSQHDSRRHIVKSVASHLRLGKEGKGGIKYGEIMMVAKDDGGGS